MNERIKELAKQAGSDKMGIWNVIGIEEYHQKFAELIVRECAITVQNFVDHRIPAGEYPARLKEHFGVEQ